MACVPQRAGCKHRAAGIPAALGCGRADGAGAGAPTLVARPAPGPGADPPPGLGGHRQPLLQPICRRHSQRTAPTGQCPVRDCCPSTGSPTDNPNTAQLAMHSCMTEAWLCLCAGSSAAVNFMSRSVTAKGFVGALQAAERSTFDWARCHDWPA